MKTAFTVILAILSVTVIAVVINMCSVSARFVNNGLETAYQEFKPEELLRKYEWFKDAAAQAEQKLASIKLYETRFKLLDLAYADAERKDWARADLEQYNVWQSEYVGVKASYNLLAAEYNAAMAKFNYRFTNVGDLPQGATIPLPREFKPYITE